LDLSRICAMVQDVGILSKLHIESRPPQPYGLRTCGTWCI